MEPVYAQRIKKLRWYEVADSQDMILASIWELWINVNSCVDMSLGTRKLVFEVSAQVWQKSACKVIEEG